MFDKFLAITLYSGCLIYNNKNKNFYKKRDWSKKYVPDDIPKVLFKSY